MKLQERVSLRIKTIRKRRGLTQAQLAERIEMARRMTDKGFQTAVQLLDAIGGKKARAAGKA